MLGNDERKTVIGYRLLAVGFGYWLLVFAARLKPSDNLYRSRKLRITSDCQELKAKS